MEFALIFGDDWLLLPCEVESATLVAVDGLVVTDVFGRQSLISPVGTAPAAPWQRWSMYAPSGARDAGLFVPRTAHHAAEGPPIEEVVFIRDENANMVWGVEQLVPLPTGDARRAVEVSVGTAEPEPAAAVADVAHRRHSSVPENWIAFVPVRIPGSDREIQLQRAALIREDGQPVRPRTSLLGTDEPFFVHEEEVVESGTRLQLA